MAYLMTDELKLNYVEHGAGEREDNEQSYICVFDKGVAYRNSQDFDDRYEQISGPALNDIVKPRAVEGNWMTLDIRGHGTKYLPIRGNSADVKHAMSYVCFCCCTLDIVIPCL